MVNHKLTILSITPEYKNLNAKKKLTKVGNIAIYVYWSQSNSLDENTLNYVNELLSVAEEVLFVSNSKLDIEHISTLNAMGVSFLQRDNNGFDFWGWKEGIEYLEDEIKNAKNLILCNSSCFLAFDRLGALLERMDEAADVWGVTSFRDQIIDFHLQSYFLVFKRSILKNWDSFISFWISLPRLRSWKDAVDLGEIRLTNFYLDMGFKCRAIVEASTLPSKDLNPSFYYPVELLSSGSPFIKKKVFTENYSLYLSVSSGSRPRDAMNYIRQNGGHYNQILKALIKTSTPSQLIQTLQLNYFVNNNNTNERRTSSPKTAVICFVFYKDTIDYICNILIRFNLIADIYIVSSNEGVLHSYEDKLINRLSNVEYRLQENKGRNEAAFFITCKDVWKKYRYVCALHDKKTSHARPALQGMEFMRHCEQNLCSSQSAILEILGLFEDNPLLGLLVPPLPFFGNFIPAAYKPLGRNRISISLLNNKFFAGNLFNRGQIDVFSAPFGGMFWARTDAFSTLLNSRLSIEDFPVEPIKTFDGTILHAMERSYPLIAKLSGFYTARIIDSSLLPLLYNNLLYFCIRLSYRHRIFFIIKNILKQRLFRYPVLSKIVRRILRKITSH